MRVKLQASGEFESVWFSTSWRPFFSQFLLLWWINRMWGYRSNHNHSFCYVNGQFWCCLERKKRLVESKSVSLSPVQPSLKNLQTLIVFLEQNSCEYKIIHCKSNATIQTNSKERTLWVYLIIFLIFNTKVKLKKLFC